MDITNGCTFYEEKETYSGVKKIAKLVKKDFELVAGRYPDSYRNDTNTENLIIYGTVGNSPILSELEKNGKIKLKNIVEKREVFGFFLVDKPIENVEHALVIAGSDKRGTIYGLFHLSEKLGVSPLVNWNHVLPEKKKISLTEKDEMISKEPSVKYRGIFINDEWPAFGTWASEHFGGINAKCYEKIFELLLRLKGNYLWPAMWRSNFNLDGPGLESAKLADELGIVMSTSHHEPCMRAGEEFTQLGGEDTPYGNEWNFLTNREGITNFWRDGLIRNKDFENVITMGMRGERDTAILGRNAGLEANIDLLRNVIKTQNQLIKETINEDLSEVPRQMVLFTEVEEFFYGDEKTKGLIGNPELDGVTLILSDNNFGYTRTLPTKDMRAHKGGYGMYYHMDMHGGAHSYQWIGSTYLPRVCEQMTQAYEYGVREIWVTNIGDIGTQEYGLSYFLDLAYDIEKWGGEDCSITEKYTKKWVEDNFNSAFEKEDLKIIEEMIWSYTSLLAKRKHEIMNADIYHPVHYGEAQRILDESEKLLLRAEELREKCSKENYSSFVSLLYYPVCGTANLMKMWILAGRNKLFAHQNRIEANMLIDKIKACLEKDAALVKMYESVDGGYYKGFGTSPHIGFTNWNDEDCKYPVLHEIVPAKGPRMLLSRAEDEHYMTGQYWCDHEQTWENFLRPDIDYVEFDISNGGDEEFYYELQTNNENLSFSSTSGFVNNRKRITLHYDRSADNTSASACISVKAYANKADRVPIADAVVKVKLPVKKQYGKISSGTFIENDGYIAINAENFSEKKDTSEGYFEVLRPYGRCGSAVKAFPSTTDFYETENRPYVKYRFWVKDAGKYIIWFYLSPTTPVTFKPKQFIGYSINGGSIEKKNTVIDDKSPFFLSQQWETEAKDCIKKTAIVEELQEGENVLTFYGMSPGIILEKIIIHKEDVKLPYSYLGPIESYRAE